MAGPGEGPLLGLDFSVFPHRRRRRRELLGVPFIRALIPSEGSICDQITSQRPSPTTTLGISISAREFGGDTNIQSIAVTEV